MSDSVVFVLLVALALVYLEAAKKTPNTRRPPAPPSSWHSSLLHLPNLMRMLRYRAELSDLDHLLEAVSASSRTGCTAPGRS